MIMKSHENVPGKLHNTDMQPEREVLPHSAPQEFPRVLGGRTKDPQAFSKTPISQPLNAITLKNEKEVLF